MSEPALRQRGRCLALASLVLAAAVSECRAARQEPDLPPQAATETLPSPEFAAFAEWLARAEQMMQTAPRWQLKADAQLRTGLDSKTTATIRLAFWSRAPWFRLEVREQPKNSLQFLAVYRESELLRFAGAAQQFSRITTETPLSEMPACGLTHWYLDLVGIPFLLTADPSATIFSNVSQVADLGSDSRGRHFRVTYHDGHRGEWWFMPEAPRLPIEIRDEKTVAIAADREVRWNRTTKLQWNLDSDVPDSAFEFHPPEGSQQVDDLAASRSGRGTEELLGKPLPELNLIDLQQQPVARKDWTQPTLLYFWATWAAPSTEQISSVLEFGEQLQTRGIQIRAINVGESSERVQPFLSANSIQAEVWLDHDGNAAHALRLTHLPAVVLVDGKQTVRAIFQNTSAASREAILSAVEALSPPPQK